MPLYRPASGPSGSPGRGADEDAVEAANQFVDNLIDTLYPNTDDGGAGKAAAKAFADAAQGSIDKGLLPDVEVCDPASLPGSDSSFGGVDASTGLDSLVKNIADMAGNLADPFGVINAVIGFLVALFTQAAAQVGAVAMSASDLYAQAAVAAADSTKKLLGDVDSSS